MKNKETTFKTTIKEAIQKWNDKNPTLRQKNLTTLAEEVGTYSQQLSILENKPSKQFLIHCKVIFATDDKEKIKQVWESYKQIDIKEINRLEQIRVSLECEIWDLITKIKK